MYMQLSINSPISCGHDQHWQSQNALLISAYELLEELAGSLALRGFIMIDLTDGYLLSVPNAAVAISVHLARSPPLRSTHQLLQHLVDDASCWKLFSRFSCCCSLSHTPIHVNLWGCSATALAMASNFLMPADTTVEACEHVAFDRIECV